MLEVRELRVALETARGTLIPVADISFSIAPGETLALLGESGCGKSMTALALARLLPDGGSIAGGTVELGGDDLLAMPEAQMRRVRGGRIGMIFQEPSTSLNPVMRVGAQITEALTVHRGLRGDAAREEAVRLLAAVGIPDPARRVDDFPFQFSGGMRQRAMIAIALAGEPGLLIADEPTTALDVTIQAQVLDLLQRLQRERAMAMLLITHDLGVAARMANRVGVMYAGELVETGPRGAFFRTPLHPYSRKLFAALPTAAQRGGPLQAASGSVPAPDQIASGCRFADRCPHAFDRCDDEPPAWRQLGAQAVRCHLYDEVLVPRALEAASMATPAASTIGKQQKPIIELRGLEVHFPLRKGLLQRTVGQVRAVDGVDLALHPGRTLALVGESGCGKTTVGKAMLHLVRPTGGQVCFEGETLDSAQPETLQAMRRAVQMVFQDPFASLNPRMRIGDIIEEGMIGLGVEPSAIERSRKVDALLDRIGLSAAMRHRYPHEFSGGQRQRIAIARALAVAPRAIVCDEPTSALDVSVQAQLLNLLRELQHERGMAYLFITHNIAVVEYLADDVAVMYLGRIVERGPAERVLNRAAHPYTRMLLAAVPRLDEGLEEGAAHPAQRPSDLPSPLAPPAGCHFHPRCPSATDICRMTYPAETRLEAHHHLRCHWPQR
ncbi:probable ABC transporter, ATP-binding protein [Azoarcus olearius]|uniref:Probable ABC transporter, ATP-binding protein n=1 Tax=Azoarcus sp. (strain BH72) TaxID=418699 RepID=A1K773_AZOSB|nr:probable ABC transporter, ATP-binding protein [Azoarcus olearius]